MIKDKDFKKQFKELMEREEFQVPKRVDEEYKTSLCKLLDTYKESLSFMNTVQQEEIAVICEYLCTMANLKNADAVLMKFQEMMNTTKLLANLNIIRDELPIDGYGIKNANLFRIREYGENRNYKRKDIFHIPLNMFEHARALRYNISGFPSLYLCSTIYGCCDEMGKSEKDKIIGSMFRLRTDLLENQLYIIDLGVRPADFIKYVNYRDTGRRNFRYTEYLYVYPLIAACSFIAANKKVAVVNEYSISNALFRWIYLNHSDKVCGVRYFSCAKKEYMIRTNEKVQKETDANASFTRYFINYALSIEESTKQFSKKLTDAFYVTKPKIMEDFIDIKDFETNIKKDVKSLQSIYE